MSYPHYHGHSFCAHPYHTPYNPCMVPYIYYHYPPCCPVCCQPYHLCCCVSGHKMILPQEVWVDASSPSKEVFIGGISDVKLTLEYMPAGSPPDVNITITDPGGSTSTWNESPIPAGYHVKSDFSTVTPGSLVKIGVANAMARLRWCEVVEC